MNITIELSECGVSITRALTLEDDVVKGMGLDRDFEGDRAL